MRTTTKGLNAFDVVAAAVIDMVVLKDDMVVFVEVVIIVKEVDVAVVVEVNVVVYQY